MSATAKPPETRWQRFMRSFLYGRDVDRNVKAKARLGLAIVAFAGIYGVIALRLVMFAEHSDGHGGRRSVGQDAVATARPDILDRNGMILATDVKTPSLFAEPRKLIDVDEAEELLTAVHARSRHQGNARAAVVEEGLRLAQARDHAAAAARDPPARHSRRRLPYREQARLSERPGSLRTRSATSISTTRASPASRNGWTGRGSPRCTWRGSPPTGCSGRCSSRSICACSSRCATNWSKRARSSRPRPRPASSSTSTPARSSRWCRSPTTIPTIRARPTIRPASTGSPPASTRWARPSRCSRWRWRSIPAR